MAPSHPPYLQIVAEIRRRITAGELRPGDRVPSTRQIIREWGVAMATATKVLTTLRQQGVVRTAPGIGTVVANLDPSPPSSSRTARHRRSREPEQELTTKRIVRTAIEIADTEGLAALSLRRIAAALDAATMTLYRYVAGKDELILLMAEAAFAETALPEPLPPGWRARLELVARLQWATHRRHPWLVQAMSLTRPRPAPQAMAHTEWALRAVDGLGLDPVTMLYIHIITFSYVRGFAVNFELESEAQQNTGITGQQWMESQDSALASILASGSFPMMARVTAQPHFAFDLDSIFEFGLHRVLDGIGVLIAEQVATCSPAEGIDDVSSAYRSRS